ncbi:hypothetical protein JOB18_033835%2C partial [Xyrichtys novacula]|uniref:Uncharacterized protein n=1 Tax=Xyrichtys novacula TaxID=13765 RepID=A0AAV1H283_XYRNO|nr:hypothetical protein JOB18_033835%2C partial [Xyrichtys novacula]
MGADKAGRWMHLYARPIVLQRSRDERGKRARERIGERRERGAVPWAWIQPEQQWSCSPCCYERETASGPGLTPPVLKFDLLALPGLQQRNRGQCLKSVLHDSAGIPANPPAYAPLVDWINIGGHREEVPDFNQTLFVFDPFSSNLCPHGSPAVRQPEEGAASLLILPSLTFFFLPIGIRLHPGNHLGTPGKGRKRVADRAVGCVSRLGVRASLWARRQVSCSSPHPAPPPLQTIRLSVSITEGRLTVGINPPSSRRVLGPYQLGTGP